MSNASATPDSPAVPPAPPSESASGVGETLRKLRVARGSLLREVASASGLDVALLSKIERGLRLPTGEQSAALAKFFGVPVRELDAARIADHFWRLYGEHPAADLAVTRIQETAAEYRAKAPVARRSKSPRQS